MHIVVVSSQQTGFRELESTVLTSQKLLLPLLQFILRLLVEQTSFTFQVLFRKCPSVVVQRLEVRLNRLSLLFLDCFYFKKRKRKCSPSQHSCFKDSMHKYIDVHPSFKSFLSAFFRRPAPSCVSLVIQEFCILGTLGQRSGTRESLTISWVGKIHNVCIEIELKE